MSDRLAGIRNARLTAAEALLQRRQRNITTRLVGAGHTVTFAQEAEASEGGFGLRMKVDDADAVVSEKLAALQATLPGSKPSRVVTQPGLDVALKAGLTVGKRT